MIHEMDAVKASLVIGVNSTSGRGSAGEPSSLRSADCATVSVGSLGRERHDAPQQKQRGHVGDVDVHVGGLARNEVDDASGVHGRVLDAERSGDS